MAEVARSSLPSQREFTAQVRPLMIALSRSRTLPISSTSVEPRIVCFSPTKCTGEVTLFARRRTVNQPAGPDPTVRNAVTSDSTDGYPPPPPPSTQLTRRLDVVSVVLEQPVASLCCSRNDIVPSAWSYLPIALGEFLSAVQNVASMALTPSYAASIR